MPKTTSKTFESPYFLRMDIAVADAWLATGLRKPSAMVQSMGNRERAILEAWRGLSYRHPKTQVFSVQEVVQEAIEQEELSSTDENYLRQGIKIVMAKWAHCGVVWREAAANHPSIPFTVHRGQVYRLQSHAEVLQNWKGGRADTQDNQTLWRKDRATGQRKVPKSVEQERANIEATLGLVSDYLQPDSALSPPEENERRYPMTLALVTQLIEKCVRATVRQDAQGINSTIELAGEKVKTSTSRIFHHWEKGLDYGIMTADDAQLLLIILMRAATSIEQDLVMGRQPVNRQSLDLRYVTQLVSHGEPSPSVFISLQKGMARILNTVFSFELAPDGGLARQLSGSSGNKANQRVRLQLLERPAEGSSLGDEGANVTDDWVPTSGMRYFSYSLHPLLWNGLLDGQGLGVHPRLVSERSGLLHKVYYHLRYHSSLDRSYTVTSEQLMYRTHMLASKNVARSRVDFSQQLWRGLKSVALQGSLFELPDELKAPMVIKFYDLNLKVEPSLSHKGALVIEARHSQETLDILRDTGLRKARIKELAALATTSTALALPDA